MSLARAVAWNTIVQVVGRVLGLVASIAQTAIILRTLELTTFGQLTVAASFIALFTVLGEAGLYLVAIRRASQEPQRRAAILGTALALRLLWSLPVLGVGVLMAQLVPTARFPTYDASVKIAIGIAAMNSYLTLLNQFLAGIFRMHLRMDLAVIGEAGSRFVTLGAVVLALASGGGMHAVLWALMAGTAANTVYAWVVVRRFESFRPRLDRQLARELLRESKVLALVTILGLMRSRIDMLLLSALVSAFEVGVYGAATRVHEVLVSFPGLFVQLLYPVLSKFAAADRAGFQRVFQRAIDVLLLGGVGVALVLILTAPQITAVLGAPEATRPMRILAFGLPGAFVALGFSFMLYAGGHHAIVARVSAGLVLFHAGLNWFAIRAWSYNGAAAVAGVTELVSLLIMNLYWTRARQLHIDRRSLWCVPLATAIGVGVELGLRAFRPDAAAAVLAQLASAALWALTATTLYGGAIVGLGLLPREVLRTLLPQRVASSPGRGT